MSETLYTDLWISPDLRLHPNLPLVWRRLLFYEDRTTENFASLRLRPEGGVEGKGLARLNRMNISFVWSRRGKARGRGQ